MLVRKMRSVIVDCRCPIILEFLDVFTEQTVQRFLAGHRDAMRLAQATDKLDGKGMQPIKTVLGLIFLDNFANLPRHRFEITIISSRCERIEVGHRRRRQKARNNAIAILRNRAIFAECIGFTPMSDQFPE